MTPAFEPYAPLDTLKPFGRELWIVDGPEIAMCFPFGVRFPFPTRMTVARLPSGAIWIHSPVAWNDALGEAVAALGPVRHLVAPNTLHFSYIAEWLRRFPGARTYGVPGIDERARRPVGLDEVLGDAPPAAWEGAFDQLLVAGSVLTEADFLHHASRTLILTDLIENFEPRRIRNFLVRWIVQFGGAADPDGKAPIDMQWSFRGRRARLRAAVDRMIGWRPERIVLAHGRCYERDAVEELRRACRWVR
jgi:hypothetical protein